MTSRALMVMAHTRCDWLIAQVAARAEARLEADGVAVDLLDLGPAALAHHQGTQRMLRHRRAAPFARR
jgi:hypothetical protein